MGEDFNTSDCSWKKMVIAKANNEWVSTIKSERIDMDNAMNTNYNFSAEQTPFGNIKRENEDANVEQTYHNIGEEPDELLQGMEPIFVDTNCEQPKRRRRKSSISRNETPDERAVRLAKMSAYAAQRLANESSEQRALRLKRMSEYAARRLAQETSEQRAKRLARMSAYAAKRLAEETPEQRRARLARMSAYAARRQAMKKITNPNNPESFNLTDPTYSQQLQSNLMSNQS